MDLEKTEARNDCAGEDQQQFNLPTDQVSLLANCFVEVSSSTLKMEACFTETSVDFQQTTRHTPEDNSFSV
jgi:hypothetical protein